MPTFDYSADDEQGRPCSGRIAADSWSAAQEALRVRGLSVRTLHAVDEGPPAVIEEWVQPAQRGSTSILLSLQALAEELPAREGRAAVATVVRRLERGEPLDAAFRAEQQRLPSELQGLIDIGLPSGRVDFLIHDYLEHCRRAGDLRRSVLTTMAYPVFLLAVLIAVMAMVFAAIVPVFASIFRDFNTSLPAITAGILRISDVFVHSWPTLLALVVGVPACAYVVLRVALGRGGPQRVFRTIPVLGRGFRWASLSNFCQLLATLVELGAPLPQALRAVAAVNDDWSLTEAVYRAAQAIESGKSPQEAIQHQAHWLNELSAAFHWADRGDDFVESLRASGDVFAARSRVQTSLVFWVMEPLILLVVAVTIGVLIVALFLPFVKLLNDLS